MKELALLRHAKSAWDNPRLDDHYRPLAPRGQAACRAMARHWRETGYRPDLVLCSTALRARETWQRISAALGDTGCELRYEPKLYLVGAAGVLKIVRKLGDVPATRLLVVGHNPDFQMLASELVRITDPDMARRIDRKFPTAAFMRFEVDIGPWSELDAGRVSNARLVTPRDLTVDS